MKKVLSYILLAGIALFGAVSCVHEPLAIFDPAGGTKPVMSAFSGVTDGDAITAEFIPGSFNTDFNKNVPVTHTFAIVKVDDKDVSKVVSSTVKDNTISTTKANLSRVLMTLGYPEQSTVNVSMVVRAMMQNPAQDNGLNGFLDSDAATINGFLVEVPQASGDNPYENFTEKSAWSVTGSLSEYGISWNGDIEMVTDGTWHVARAVVLKAGDELKFRKDADWAENFGYVADTDQYVLGEEFAVAQDGPNIKVLEDGTYDLLVNPGSQLAKIVVASVPYADYTEASAWSVTGALSEYGISWNGDIEMTTNGTWHVAQNVTLKAGDELKFRKDADWAENFGYVAETDQYVLGEEFAVSQDGPNIKVLEDGAYDLLLNPAEAKAKIVNTLGGGGTKPTPPPAPTYEGWSIIGDFNSWGGDVDMTEEEGVWTGYFTNTLKEDGTPGKFKLRKDHDWAVSVGGTFAAFGEAFDAVSENGPDIEVPAGFYKVVYDTANQKITIYNDDVYSLIGQINGDSWTVDVEMTEADGVYTSPVVFISGGFKIRHNHSWADDDTYGAAADASIEPGKAFTAVQPGSDIKIPEGNYSVRFTLATKEVLITSVNYEVPNIDLSAYEKMDIMAGAETWGIIGPAVSDWTTDVDLQKISTDPEIWAAMNVPFQASSFKFRGNDTWGDYDLGGGTFAIETPIVMTKGGGDMTAERGVYTVFLYPVHGIAYLVKGNGEVPEPPTPTFEGWSVIGSLTNWENDIDMTQSGAFWVARNVTLAASDQFKFRKDHDWGTNIGAPGEVEPYVVEIGTKYEGAPGGKNLAVPADGNYDLYVNPDAVTFYVMKSGEVPAEISTWGVVGTITGWGNDAPDLAMSEENGMLVRKNVALTVGDQFKVRYMSSWDVNRGGPGEVEPYVLTGEPFEAVPGGKNLGVAENGNYDIWYDSVNEVLFVMPAGTAPAYWGVVGSITGWGNDRRDYVMTRSGDFLVAKGIEIAADAQFKIRYNSNWDVNRGAPGEVEPYKVDAGAAIDATPNGKNLGVNAAGKYDIYYDAAAEKMYVMAEGAVPTPAPTPATIKDFAKEYVKIIDVWEKNVGTINRLSAWKVAEHGDKDVVENAHYIPNDTKITVAGKDFNIADMLETALRSYLLLRGWDGLETEKNGYGNIPTATPVAMSETEVPPTHEYSFGTPLIESSNGGYLYKQVGDKQVFGQVDPLILDNWAQRSVNFQHGKNITNFCGYPRDPITNYGGCFSSGRALITYAFFFKYMLDNNLDKADGIAADVVIRSELFGLETAAPAAVKITIDGDMSEWADVKTGVSSESGPYYEFKVAYDDENLYFYSKRDFRNTYWAGNGYFYYGIDEDNNEATAMGDPQGMPGADEWVLIYPFGGTNDAPVIPGTPVKGGLNSWDPYAYPENSLAGKIGTQYVETEFKCPRSALKIKAGTVKIYSWGNKDAANFKTEGVTLKIEK